MASGVAPDLQNLELLFPYPAIRCRRIVRDSEKRVGDLRLDSATALQLSRDNIGVLAGSGLPTSILIEKFRELAKSEMPGQFVIALAINKLADDYFCGIGEKVDSHLHDDFWSIGCVTFTTPEKLRMIGREQLGGRPVLAVGVVDPQCYLHSARGYVSSGFAFNDRPQHFAKFRAAHEINGWRPPFFLFTERPAKSLNTNQMLAPYSLDAWWFVDGSQIRMGALPVIVNNESPTTSELNVQSLLPAAVSEIEKGETDIYGSESYSNSNDISIRFEFSASSDLAGRASNKSSNVYNEFTSDAESVIDAKTNGDAVSNDRPIESIEVTGDRVLASTATSDAGLSESFIYEGHLQAIHLADQEKQLVDKLQQADRLLEASTIQMQEIHKAYQAIEASLRQVDEPLKHIVVKREQSEQMFVQMQSLLERAIRLNDHTECLNQATLSLHQETVEHRDAVKLLRQESHDLTLSLLEAKGRLEAAEEQVISVINKFDNAIEEMNGRFNQEIEKLRLNGTSSVTVKTTLPMFSSNEESIGQPHSDDRILNSIGMQFVKIPQGEFVMGSTESASILLKRNFGSFLNIEPVDEFPAHRVRITKPFYVGLHAVTLGQFLRFYLESEHTLDAETKGGWGYDSTNASRPFAQKPNFRPWSWGFEGQSMDHPVVNVSWNDASAFCSWLSEKECKTYRLPTEAEWEYACRAGTETLHPMGNEIETLACIANVADQCTIRIPGAEKWAAAPFDDKFPFTAPVGVFSPNRFGLYDMIGNVAEWCEDVYAPDAYKGRLEITSDPIVGSGSKFRTVRGGSWLSDPSRSRSAFRFRLAPHMLTFSIGFRVVLVG